MKKLVTSEAYCGLKANDYSLKGNPGPYSPTALSDMKGLMYIPGSFHTVRRGVCGNGKGWIDNDPHFWTNPPTWGIYRNDLRRRAVSRDYVFFVLPKGARHPQCLFACLHINERKSAIRDGRWDIKTPNGNIIVDATGGYNRFDKNVHLHKFKRIRHEYAVGIPESSQLSNESEIDRLAPQVNDLLQRLFGRSDSKPIDSISRYGRTLSSRAD